MKLRENISIPNITGTIPNGTVTKTHDAYTKQTLLVLYDNTGSLNHDILPSRMAGRLGSHGLKWREWRGEDTGIPF